MNVHQLKIQQVRIGPGGRSVIMRIEGDAVLVHEQAGGFVVYDKAAVQSWPKVIRARQATGWTMTFVPFVAGPKWTILCGACPATFRERIALVAYPTVQCPNCGTWNEIPVKVEEDND